MSATVVPQNQAVLLYHRHLGKFYKFESTDVHIDHYDHRSGEGEALDFFSVNIPTSLFEWKSIFIIIM